MRHALALQIDDSEDDYHFTGVLYSLTKALAWPTKAADWHTMEITIDGRRPDQGYFGLQNHSGKDIVYFRDVSLKEMHRD